MCSEMPNTHMISIQKICIGLITGKVVLVLQHPRFIIKRKTNIRMTAIVIDTVNIRESIMTSRVRDTDWNIRNGSDHLLKYQSFLRHNFYIKRFKNQ